MSNKQSVLLVFVSIASLLFVVIQHKNIKQIETILDKTIAKNNELNDYILSTFNIQSNNELIDGFSVRYLEQYEYILYVPLNLCRACFSSLIFYLQDYGIPTDKICVISGASDFEIQSECISRNIKFIDARFSAEELPSIKIYKQYRGIIPLRMNYNIGRENILEQFLSDEEENLSAIMGIN